VISASGQKLTWAYVRFRREADVRQKEAEAELVGKTVILSDGEAWSRKSPAARCLRRSAASPNSIPA
jgi:hypothetical protein